VSEYDDVVAPRDEHPELDDPFGAPRSESAESAEPAAESPSVVRTGPASPARVEPNAPERLWGFECWWRPDPDGAGLTETDRTEIEQSKKLLRGLMRDSRRSTRPALPR